MDEVPILGHAEDNLFKRVLSSYDVPAYIRRARRVEDAFQELLAQCHAHRQELAQTAQTRLGTLWDLAGEHWQSLRPLVEGNQIAILDELKQLLQPVSRGFTRASARLLRRALHELGESLERFNRRWSEYLNRLELGTINELREKYNRYYLLEKECAVRSPRVARQGFKPMQPLTHEELRSLFPLLPVPRL